MAQLDPRNGPPEQNLNVTREYLDELYDKADRLRELERYLAALQADDGFCCTIGDFNAWRSQNSHSARTSRLVSMQSA